MFPNLVPSLALQLPTNHQMFYATDLLPHPFAGLLRFIWRDPTPAVSLYQ